MLSYAHKIDPTGFFESTGATNPRIIESLGIVPVFVAEAATRGTPSEATPRSVLDDMAQAYGFYMGDMEGGTVTPEGIYQYPEDKDLHPLMQWTLDDSVVIYMYKYAIIALTDGERTIITRMD